MRVEEKEELSRLGDISHEAISFRLRAARLSLCPPISQKSMANLLEISPQKYGNWETGVALPSLASLKHFMRAYRIDFNFVLHGDFAQLPADVQERLFKALEKMTKDQTE